MDLKLGTVNKRRYNSRHVVDSSWHLLSNNNHRHNYEERSSFLPQPNKVGAKNT